MPLLLPTIKDNLAAIIDNTSPSFKGFPSSKQQMADNWGFAVNNYCQGIFPISSSIEEATNAFIGVMLQMDITNGLAIIPNAFDAFKAILAQGMLPLYSATPPIIKIDFSPTFAIPLVPDTIGQRVESMATIIDNWFHTGLATNISSGVTSNWL